MPVIHEAFDPLGAEDRTAISPRFFERLDFRSVGAALGSNETAAQKRVSRALKKLRLLLRQRVLRGSLQTGRHPRGENYISNDYIAIGAVSGQGGHDSQRRYFPNGTVAPIGDIDSAVFVHGKIPRILKQSVSAGVMVAAEGDESRDGVYREVGTDFPNGIIVNNIEVARWIRGYAAGGFKKGVRAHAVDVASVFKPTRNGRDRERLRPGGVQEREAKYKCQKP